MTPRLFRVFAVLLLGAVPASVRGEDPPLRLYVGTYTNGTKSEGIYLFELDLETGKLTPKGVAAKSVDPSFLAIHPEKDALYCVNEVAELDGTPGGAVSAFRIDPRTGKLTLLNRQSTKGAGPCHLTVDRTGKNVLVANYGGGSVACLPLENDRSLRPASSFIQHTGKSADPARQEAPHAHSINLDAANRYAVAADLGLDKVLVYRFDPRSGRLSPNEPPSTALPPGSGPRHFAFHPDGRHAFVINEMALTLTLFNYEPARGVLTVKATEKTLPVPPGGGNSTAEVVVHPSGRFVYGSNRGADSIAVFVFDPAAETLRRIALTPTRGHTPRNFAVTPDGRWLLAENQSSDTISVFRIAPDTGLLTPIGDPTPCPAPVCIRFLSR